MRATMATCSFFFAFTAIVLPVAVLAAETAEIEGVLKLTSTSIDITNATEAINKLDLHLVGARVQKEQGYNSTQTDLGLREYRRFLVLATQTRAIAPSHVVDLFWHAHILFTRSYAADCERVGFPGGFLHHQPELEAGTSAEHYAHTLELYAKVFGEEAPTSVWGRATPSVEPSCMPHCQPSGCSG